MEIHEGCRTVKDEVRERLQDELFTDAQIDFILGIVSEVYCRGHYDGFIEHGEQEVWDEHGG